MANISDLAIEQLIQATKQLTAAMQQQGGQLSSAGNEAQQNQSQNPRQNTKEKAYNMQSQRLLKDVGRTKEELKLLQTKSDRTIVDLQNQVRLGSQFMNDTINRATSESALQEIPQKLNDVFMKSTSDVVKQLGGTVKTIEDVLNVESQIVAMKDLSVAMDKVQKGSMKQAEFARLATSKQLEGVLDFNKMGIDLQKYTAINTKLQTKRHKVTKEEIAYLKETNQKFANLNKNTAELSGAFNTAVSELSRTNDAFSSVEFSASSVVAALGLLGKEVLDSTRAAAKFGTTISPIAAITMGMSSADWAETQAQFRQSALAMGGVGKWTSAIESNRMEMIALTGNLADATRFSAASVQNLRSMGDATIDVTAGLRDEAKMAADFRNQTGMTATEFANMTESLIADEDMRWALMRTTEKERKSVMDNTRARILEYQALGMTRDQALAAAKALQGVAGETPLERLKRAAKTQAVAGMMGMGGSEAAQLGELIRRQKFLNDDEKAKLGELQMKASQLYSEKMGNAATEFATGMVASRLGLADTLGPSGVFSQAQLAQGRALDDQTKLMFESKSRDERIYGVLGDQLNVMNQGNSYWAQLLSGYDQLFTFIKGPLFGAVVAIGTAIGGKSLLNAIGGKGKELTPAPVRKTISKIGELGKAAGLAASGITAAGAAGYAVGALIENNLEDDTRIAIADTIGPALDHVVALFSDDAATRIANREKQAQAEKDAFARRYLSNSSQAQAQVLPKAQLSTQKNLKDLQTQAKEDHIESVAQLKQNKDQLSAILEALQKQNQITDALKAKMQDMIDNETMNMDAQNAILSRKLKSPMLTR